MTPTFTERYNTPWEASSSSTLLKSASLGLKTSLTFGNNLSTAVETDV